MTASNWLPIDFEPGPRQLSVKWMDFGANPISDPFFYQTLDRLRSSDPPAAERSTGVQELVNIAGSFPVVRPSGLIFHISRCGSTLVSNVLRTLGPAVLSEARPVGMFFHPSVGPPTDAWPRMRAAILDAVTTLYARTAMSARNAMYTPQLVIKCHAFNILQMKFIRALWPGVPVAVVIRDPVEVIASNLAQPAGWVGWRKQSAAAANAFGWTERDVERMTIEEYCARGIGQFCEIARDQVDQHCKVIDYENLTLENILAIAEFFGLETLLPDDASVLQQVLSADAKDPLRQRAFENDSPRKRKEAGDAVQQAADRWARKPYELLKSSTRT